MKLFVVLFAIFAVLAASSLAKSAGDPCCLSPSPVRCLLPCNFKPRTTTQATDTCEWFTTNHISSNDSSKYLHIFAKFHLFTQNVVFYVVFLKINVNKIFQINLNPETHYIYLPNGNEAVLCTHRCSIFYYFTKFVMCLLCTANYLSDDSDLKFGTISGCDCLLRILNEHFRNRKVCWKLLSVSIW